MSCYKKENKEIFIEKKGKDKDVNVLLLTLKKHKDRWKKYKGNKKIPSKDYIKYEVML